MAGIESVHPDGWTRKEKGGVAKLVGFSGLKKSKSKVEQADKKLVCYWSSGINKEALYSLSWCQ
ncbi:hypothetical protein TNCV_2575201, partial [Trichonephila clavipes]